MSLKGIAQENLEILAAGRYENASGAIVQLAAEQERAVRGTLLYTPERAQALLERLPPAGSGAALEVEVTPETTQEAARRLAEAEGCADLMVLNFASARNPGGGFLNGARAQEEDLARCSGLYPCLLEQPAYYEANRALDSMLYTDHLIYSPGVPWFRGRRFEPLERIFLAAVITAPAPNAGEALKRDPGAWPAIEETLRRRARLILAVAREHGHRSLLLGAWGCGVFRNEPQMVALAFKEALEDARFAGRFERVVFAVYDPTAGQRNLNAFRGTWKS